MRAGEKGYLAVVKELLGAGANVNATTNVGAGVNTREGGYFKCYLLFTS